MVTKFVLVISLCVAMMGLAPFVASQDWQSAELVEEIRRTDDAMWIHEGSVPAMQSHDVRLPSLLYLFPFFRLLFHHNFAFC